MKRVLVDAGPIVAYLNPKDRFHAWAVEQFERVTVGTTCEAVIAETCARLAYYRTAAAPVIEMVLEGVLLIDFDLAGNAYRILRLMKDYQDHPMDLADACLVVMSEGEPDSAVMTLDEDFRYYRRFGRQVIPTIMPS